jgi:hypothetical protein
VETVYSYILLKAGDPFDFLFGSRIPAKELLIRMVYSLPGFLLALLIGVTIGVLVEAIVRGVSQKVAASKAFGVILALVCLSVVGKLVWDTKFTWHVAYQTGWWRLFYSPTPQVVEPRESAAPSLEDESQQQQQGARGYGTRRRLGGGL